MSSFKRGIVWLLKPWSSNKYSYNFFNQCYRFALFGLFGDEWDFSRNGEIPLLTFLKDKLAGRVVIFDVGANEGGYTEALLATFNNVKVELIIHGFEPASDTFNRYSAKFKGVQNVICNNVGLSNQAHVMRLYKSGVSSGVATLYDENKFNFSSFEEIALTTIDEYCTDNKIEMISFLKMDVEGHELAVLEGAKQMLLQRNIKVIQFEFGAGNISSKTYFKNFYELLSNDFTIYRIVKNGLIPIRKYDYSLEAFGRVTNYVAIVKSLN